MTILGDVHAYLKCGKEQCLHHEVQKTHLSMTHNDTTFDRRKCADELRIYNALLSVT
jgi:hypothetical protein